MRIFPKLGISAWLLRWQTQTFVIVRFCGIFPRFFWILHLLVIHLYLWLVDFVRFPHFFLTHLASFLSFNCICDWWILWDFFSLLLKLASCIMFYSVGFFLTSFESWILHLFIIHLYLWILWDFFSLLLNASCIFLFIFFTGAHLCPTHSYFYLTNKTKQKREKWFTCADFCPSHSYLYIFDTKKGETVTLLTCAHLCSLNASRMLFFISHLCASLPGEQLQS